MNLLNKKQVQTMLVESLVSKYVKRYSGELKMFLFKLKEQFKYNKQARTIIKAYIESGMLTDEQAEILKNITKDVLKMTGLGGVIFLPGGTAIMIFLLKLAKMLKIDLLPTKFKNTKNTNTIVINEK